MMPVPPFASGTPLFWQSQNPLDLNLAVQNRFTGKQDICFYDNTAWLSPVVQDFVYEIPFDVKWVQAYSYFENNIPGQNGFVTWTSSWYSVKPFWETIETFSSWWLKGNCNGTRHELFIYENVTSNFDALNATVDDVLTSSWAVPITNLVIGVSWAPFDLPVYYPTPYVASEIWLFATFRPTCILLFERIAA
jgi:hypothetical protein